MRIGFLLVVLAGAVFYTYIAFVDLNFFSRAGRLGPGFFPRIVGVLMIVLTIWALADAIRDRRGPKPAAGSWRDVAMLMALALGYAVLLRLFGGFAATVAYLAVTLSLLNRGRHLQNGVLAITIPAAVYLLFDKVLNASVPPALFELPF